MMVFKIEAVELKSVAGVYKVENGKLFTLVSNPVLGCAFVEKNLKAYKGLKLNKKNSDSENYDVFKNWMNKNIFNKNLIDCSWIIASSELDLYKTL